MTLVLPDVRIPASPTKSNTGAGGSSSLHGGENPPPSVERIASWTDADLLRARNHHFVALVRGFMSLGLALPPALRVSHARAVAVVRVALEADREALRRVMSEPSISAPLLALPVRPHLPRLAARIDTQVQAVTPRLLGELALSRRIPVGPGVDWPVWDEEGIHLFSRGVVATPPQGTRLLRFLRGAIAACDPVGRELARLESPPEEAGPGAPPLAPGPTGGLRFHLSPDGVSITARTRLALTDDNPLAELEAHPEKQGSGFDLGGRSAEEWVSALKPTFALVETHLPGLAEEMRTMLRQVVPVGYHPERHLSASYREAVGTVYMTLHPDRYTLTEALVHEFQHNKLNVATYEGPMLNNAYEPLFRSPVRPDPRPLMGILLAVHAFLPVAELYRRMRDAGAWARHELQFLRRLAAIDAKNADGMATLRENGQFTELGRPLFDDLEALLARHRADPVVLPEGALPDERPLSIPD